MHARERPPPPKMCVFGMVDASNGAGTDPFILYTHYRGLPWWLSW